MTVELPFGPNCMSLLRNKKPSDFSIGQNTSLGTVIGISSSSIMVEDCPLRLYKIPNVGLFGMLDGIITRYSYDGSNDYIDMPTSGIKGIIERYEEARV